MLARLNNVSQFDSSYSDYHVSGLAEIYQTAFNLCVWERDLSSHITGYAQQLMQHKSWSFRSVVSVESIDEEIYAALIDVSDETGRRAFAKDVSVLVTLFSDLFELKHVGVRLSILDNTMCPRFHSDSLPCRLVTTYCGKGTEWLPNYAVDRTKLGHVSTGVADNLSGIYSDKNDIQQLKAGDVALLKGLGWEWCTQPIVHRSPEIGADDKRLILTLDFAN